MNAKATRLARIKNHRATMASSRRGQSARAESHKWQPISSPAAIMLIAALFTVSLASVATLATGSPQRSAAERTGSSDRSTGDEPTTSSSFDKHSASDDGSAALEALEPTQPTSATYTGGSVASVAPVELVLQQQAAGADESGADSGARTSLSAAHEQLVRSRKSPEGAGSSAKASNSSNSSSSQEANSTWTQASSTVSSLDYDDFDLDYQLKLNSSADSSKRDYDFGSSTPRPPTWSALIRAQPHVFKASVVASPSQPQANLSAEGLLSPPGLQAAHIPPALLTVKSTQLSSQELERIRPQLLQLYQDELQGSTSSAGYASDQSLAFANGDLLATASHPSGSSLLAGQPATAEASLASLASANSSGQQPAAQASAASALGALESLQLSSGAHRRNKQTNQMSLHEHGGMQHDDFAAAIAGSSADLARAEALPLSLGSSFSLASTSALEQLGGKPAPAPNSQQPEQQQQQQVLASKSDQWFNYPQPNLHQNPLLLHHILNKPALYTQQASQQDLQQQPSYSSRQAAQQDGQSEQKVNNISASISQLAQGATQPASQVHEQSAGSGASQATRSPASNEPAKSSHPEFHKSDPAEQGLLGPLLAQLQLLQQQQLLQRPLSQPLQQVGLGPALESNHYLAQLLTSKGAQLMPHAAAMIPAAALFPAPSVPVSVTVDRKALIGSGMLQFPERQVALLAPNPGRPAPPWTPLPQPAAGPTAAASLLQEMYAFKPAQSTVRAPVRFNDEDMSTYVAHLSQQLGTGTGTGAKNHQQQQQQQQPNTAIAHEEQLQGAQGHLDSQIAHLLKQIQASKNTTNLSLNDLETIVQRLLEAHLATNSTASKSDASSGEPTAAAPTRQQLETNWQHRKPTTFQPIVAQSAASQPGLDSSHLSKPVGTNGPLAPANETTSPGAGHKQQGTGSAELGQKQQVALMEALKLVLAARQHQSADESSRSSAPMGLDEIQALGSGESNVTSSQLTQQAPPSPANLLTADEFDEHLSNKPIPEWLERQIVQDSYLRESAAARLRLHGPRTAPKTLHTTYIGRPSSLRPLLFGAPAALPAHSILGHQTHLARRPNLASAGGQTQLIRVSPHQALQMLLSQQHRQQSSAMAQQHQQHQQQPLAMATLQQAHQLRLLPAPTETSSHLRTASGAERLPPLASAPAYLIKLPTLTGGTITASGSFVPPSVTRLLRPRPHVMPLRLLSVQARPFRLVASTPSVSVGAGSSLSMPALAPVTSGPASVQAAASIMHTQHQFPPLLVNSANFLEQKQQQQLAAQLQHQQLPAAARLAAHAALAAELARHQQHQRQHLQLPGALPLAAPALPAGLLAAVAAANLQARPQGAPLAPELEPQSIVARQPSGELLSGLRQQVANDLASQQALLQPVAALPAEQQPRVAPEQPELFQSAAKSTSEAGAGVPQADQHQAVGGQALTSGAALSRLQQATASLVELTSLASLVDEMSGSEMDNSPAIALVQALSSLQSQQAAGRLQQQEARRHQLAIASAAAAGVPAEVSASGAGEGLGPLAPDGAQLARPLSLKSLINAHLWRDRQLSKVRELSAMERLVAAANNANSLAQSGEHGRIKVKYIRVPVAVYEGTSEPVQAGRTGQLLAEQQLLAATGKGPQSGGSKQQQQQQQQQHEPASGDSAAQSAGSLASSSSHDYLFDEIEPSTESGGDGSKFSASTFQELSQASPAGVDSSWRLRSSRNKLKSGADPLELYYSLATSNSAGSKPAGRHTGKKRAALRGSRRNPKKKKKKENELLLMDDELAGSARLNGLAEAGETSSAGQFDDDDDDDESNAAGDDDRLTQKDLPILESIISTIFHGAPAKDTPAPAHPMVLPFPAAIVPAYSALPGAWSSGARSPLRAEASSLSESYVARPARHPLNPFSRHKFTLGEVVGALGARKLISSLLSKGRRARTSKRNVVTQASGGASLGGLSGANTAPSLPQQLFSLKAINRTPKASVAPPQTLQVKPASNSYTSVWYPHMLAHGHTSSSAQKPAVRKQEATMATNIKGTVIKNSFRQASSSNLVKTHNSTAPPVVSSKEKQSVVERKPLVSGKNAGQSMYSAEKGKQNSTQP